MEKWSDKSVLVRLENMAISGGPTSVDLNILFPGKTITSTLETTLDGNLPLSDLKRLKWKINNSKRNIIEEGNKDMSNVEINPKQIRSFLVKLS